MRRTCATRRTAVAVTERAAAGVLCLVLRFFACVSDLRGVGGERVGGLGKMEETRHPSHRCTMGWMDIPHVTLTVFVK